MGFDVIDGHQWNSKPHGDGFCGCQTDQQRAHQAGFGGHSDGRKLCGGAVSGLESGLNHGQDALHVGA